jgi:heme/copper-type cytochrome/quinol oxidase subunit 2
MGPNRSRRWRRWAVGLAVGAPLALAGCNFYPSYGASRGATTQGQETFKLYSGMMTTGIIVGGIVFLLILWTVFRYRKRSDEMPRQFHENVPIEVIYTVIPILIVAVLFFFTVITENNVDATQPLNATFTSTGKPVVNITVTAFQWGWRFDYPASTWAWPVRPPTVPRTTVPRWSCRWARPCRSPWSPTTSSTASTYATSTSAATPSPA